MRKLINPLIYKERKDTKRERERERERVTPVVESFVSQAVTNSGMKY
jgi:hypothetical protein